MADQATPTDLLAALEARLIELECQSVERQAEILKLQGFVAAYEQRIAGLEREVKRLKDQLDDTQEPPPAAFDDLPPHY